MDLASPAVSGMSVYANGLQRQMKWIYVAEARFHLLSAFVHGLNRRGTEIGRKSLGVEVLFVCLYCVINPLNAELNPICCLLALLRAHHFLHVSRIRVKDNSKPSSKCIPSAV